ncbi:Tll0287-like domain-containing protein [Mangrovicoccus algicola]|uniref:DUF3365 domain-containing protein n=1 Tax=Mangrovicoccus algicola TaxID=2771008 RepID=A0A8J6YVU4_9RHOB|nr:DUF3365 domain-containing protein [Mangrovicoccus algicola]MBE3638572.1 DUF3365 domain-containing protein [Mangrovicoccus algicola]
MGLRLKYNLVLVLACLLGIAAATVLSYVFVQRSAVEDVKQNIRLLRGNALAVRSYTLNHVEPLLEDDSDILFLPETVTAFAARTVFDTFRGSFPEYSYKESALDPTNPADRPDARERAMIEQFRADPELDQIASVLDTGAGRELTMAFPITITQEGCLRCHSTPEAAPPAMIDLYGPANGFGWQLGETVGAQFISAPMTLVEARARDARLMLIGGLALVFLLVFVMTNLLLGRMVLTPVRRMSALAEKVSLGDFSVPEYRKPGRDEISSLSASFNRMRRSLERAMSMIDG